MLKMSYECITTTLSASMTKLEILFNGTTVSESHSTIHIYIEVIGDATNILQNLFISRKCIFKRW